MHIPPVTSHNQAATDAGFIACDGAFDFSLENDVEKVPKMNSGIVSSPFTAAAAAEGSDLFSEFIEDLEWLSNKDAFPSVDTCSDILSEDLEFLLNHHNFVSVFNINGSSTATVAGPLKVPGSFPVRPRSKNRRRKRTLGFCKMPSVRVRSSMGRRCSHCQADKTPQWRAGPMGPKTLCNACGVRHKSGRLVPEYRPANSPTFSSVLHSNSHRKVMEMRRKKYQEGGGS